MTIKLSIAVTLCNLVNYLPVRLSVVSQSALKGQLSHCLVRSRPEAKGELLVDVGTTLLKTYLKGAVTGMHWNYAKGTGYVSFGQKCTLTCITDETSCIVDGRVDHASIRRRYSIINAVALWV
jgi:hypothetical protein